MSDLRFALQLIIVTYIMSVTLTIPDDYLAGTISRLHQSNDISHYPGPYVSPRVANSQVKYFFAAIRSQICTHILKKRLHTLFRSYNARKEVTWISSFVLMLVLGMVLEESQHMIHMQFKARVSRDQMTKYEAEKEADIECRSIDDGYEFLCKLFHCKYRRRRKVLARMSDYQDTLEHQGPSADFVKGLRDLCEENGQ